MKQTNSYNVPNQQWQQFGDKGQDYFNRLYESLKSQKTDILGSVNSSSSSKPNSGEYNQITDQIILQCCIEATNFYLQQKTEKQL